MASKIVGLSLFNGAVFDEQKTKKAMNYLAGRSDVELQSISLKEYERMTPEQKNNWAIVEPYLAWEKDGRLYRYVIKE